MKVFVTGAEGFIGSHVVQELLNEGFEVKALVLYNSFDQIGWLSDLSEQELEQVEIIKGDIRDPFLMQQAIQGCDAVLHLASLIAIPYSYVAPSSYIETNVMGTLNVLQAAEQAGVQRFIQTSTSEVYGTAQYVPINESHRLLGQSPYSASKIAADQMCLSYYCSFELPVTIIRPFNTYGPRQSERAIIPTVINQLLQGKQQLKLGNLTPTRDLTYVTDTAKGFIQALRHPQTIGETINLGAGFEITISDLVKMICEIINVSPIIEQDDHRIRPVLSEVNRLWSDNTKALQMLHWTPQHKGQDGLYKGLTQTIQWFEQRQKAYTNGQGKYVI